MMLISQYYYVILLQPSIYVARDRTLILSVRNVTFFLYSGTDRHQLHTKICPDLRGAKRRREYVRGRSCTTNVIDALILRPWRITWSGNLKAPHFTLSLAAAIILYQKRRENIVDINQLLGTTSLRGIWVQPVCRHTRTHHTTMWWLHWKCSVHYCKSAV